MKWVIRGVIGDVLIGLVVVAGLDFESKGQMSRTGNAWTEAFDNSVASGEPLKLAKIEPMIVGSPSRTERTTSANPATNINQTKVLTYTWSGTFRKYRIDVHVEQEGTGEETVTKIVVGGGS